MASENVWEAGPPPEFPDVTPEPERPEPDPSAPLFNAGMVLLISLAGWAVFGIVVLVLR